MVDLQGPWGLRSTVPSVKCLWVSRFQCSVFKEFIRTFTFHFVFRESVWMRDSVLRFKALFLMFR